MTEITEPLDLSAGCRLPYEDSLELNAESRIAAFVSTIGFEQIPADAVAVVKRVVLAVAGTVVAGAGEEGVEPLRRILVDRGGRPEATVLVFGDRMPAPHAALINGVMARALDFCDAMAPGIHMGSSLVTAALAAVELRGGPCDGEEFLTALVTGAEIGARLNLSEGQYDGFDPTGVAGIFAATAAVARILRLDQEQTSNALALAFNRCGGSFQSNIDGSLAVRLIQGWVAESAVNCALLARQGLTGPPNYLAGVYGYMHLFARQRTDASELCEGLGAIWLLHRMMFKKYPSCGLTQGVTELALRIASRSGIGASDIASAEVRLPPYAYRLVGHDFGIGRNARVNAQFSAQFCVANAFVRGASRLDHFREAAIAHPDILELIPRIRVVADEAMNARDHTAVDLAVTTRDGVTHEARLDFAPGFPRNPLRHEEHLSRFADCQAYAKFPLTSSQRARLVGTIETLESSDDVRSLIPNLIASAT